MRGQLWLSHGLNSEKRTPVSDKMPPESDEDSLFPETRWTLILASKGKSEASRQALDELLTIYRRPILLHFVPWAQAIGQESAEDLIHGYIQSLLERADIDTLTQEAGKFRWFIWASIKNYGLRRKAHWDALKRGAGRSDLPIDEIQELPDGSSPSNSFDRHWIGAIIDRSLKSLQRERRHLGKGEEFEQLLPFILNESDLSSAEFAKKTGRSAVSVRTAISRLRKRLRELTKEQIVQTVNGATYAKEEFDYLSDLAGIDLNPKEHDDP